MSFISMVSPPTGKNVQPYYVIFKGQHVIGTMDTDHVYAFLSGYNEDIEHNMVQHIFVGTLDGIPCYAARVKDSYAFPDKYKRFHLRELITRLGYDLYKTIVTASQILNWDSHFHFCGRCGAPTVNQPDERAKKCPECGLVSFPRISPAIMVAIIKEDKILLANGRNFPPEMYSVLAGFVEPGETIEECVIREVKEEVGLDVDQITYFSSQFWPFPDSLMIAFTAMYNGGDIVVDPDEINRAAWFGAGELPQRPSGQISISGQLIDWFENAYS